MYFGDMPYFLAVSVHSGIQEWTHLFKDKALNKFQLQHVYFLICVPGVDGMPLNTIRNLEESLGCKVMMFFASLVQEMS